jgi:hypothetical protein
MDTADRNRTCSPRVQLREPDSHLRLRDISMDYAQGFFLHQPEPFEVVLAQAISHWGQTRP